MHLQAMNIPTMTNFQSSMGLGGMDRYGVRTYQIVEARLWIEGDVAGK
jgi:hypothetical protein